MLEVATIEKTIEQAADFQRRALTLWYPQHGNNAPAERNYTVHLALALAMSFPEMALFAESSIGTSSAERIDLVGFEPSVRELIVVEAKRFLDTETAYGVLNDVDRIRSFVPSNSNGSIGNVEAKWGVVLVSTIDPHLPTWWRTAEDQAPARVRRPEQWLKLAAHLRSCRLSGAVGATEIASYPDFSRHLLWAFWREPGV